MITSISMFFFFYFLSLLSFSLVSHPVYYCGLLVFNSLMFSFICYFNFGFGWYPLLFCLVYMGGVYMLFIFVSVYSPNSNFISFLNFNYSVWLILMFFVVFIGMSVIYLSCKVEFSSCLCTLMEGKFYMCMCLTLLFGFMVLSIMMSMKLNYYR